MESVILVSSHLVFLLVGAFIAGWCSYLFRAEGASASVAREQAARRLALVEEVALQTGSVHYLFQRYCSLLADSIRLKENLPKTRRLELDKLGEELRTAFEDLSMAESRLLLLDEQKLCRVLRLYSSKMAGLKKTWSIKTTSLSEDELAALKKEVNLLRDKFFEALSSLYGNRL